MHTYVTRKWHARVRDDCHNFILSSRCRENTASPRFDDRRRRSIQTAVEHVQIRISVASTAHDTVHNSYVWCLSCYQYYNTVYFTRTRLLFSHSVQLCLVPWGSRGERVGVISTTGTAETDPPGVPYFRAHGISLGHTNVVSLDDLTLAVVRVSWINSRVVFNQDIFFGRESEKRHPSFESIIHFEFRCLYVQSLFIISFKTIRCIRCGAQPILYFGSLNKNKNMY